MKKMITLFFVLIIFLINTTLSFGISINYYWISKNIYSQFSSKEKLSSNNLNDSIYSKNKSIKQIEASKQIECLTNPPSNTGAYSWDWANNNINNYGSSVGASCTISGVPVGSTILSVKYYVLGTLINSNDSPLDHGASGVPICDEIYLRVDGPGNTYDVIDIGYTGNCNNSLINWASWSGNNTASPNGTYKFDWGSTAEYGPAQDFSVSQIKVVVTYDDGQANPCPNPNCMTLKSKTRL